MADDHRKHRIMAEAQRRANAWAEPGAEPQPAQRADRPTTGGVSPPTSNNRGPAPDQPIQVGASADLVAMRGRPFAHNAEQYSSSSQPSAHRQDDHHRQQHADAQPRALTIFDCQTCQRPFTGVAEGEKPTARAPVLLVPCGHTVCRQCCMEAMQRAAPKDPTASAAAPSTTQPQCAQCGQRFHGTAVNAAIASHISQGKVPKDPAESRAHAIVNAAVTSADTTAIAPLPPELRRALVEFAPTPADAMRAEDFARGALAHRRLEQLRSQERSVALRELEDATNATDKHASLSDALTGELRAIDAEIERLMLDRQVVMHQLTSTLQQQSECVVRRHDCARRRDTLEAVVAHHGQAARRNETFVTELVPVADVAAQLRMATLGREM